ncbi:MAG: L-threonylcarbamoyladenylate synthase [Fusobacteriaceae bacterium]
MLHIVFRSGNLDYGKIRKFLEIDNILVYPTDTVYGVGGLMSSEKALKKIYAAKKRSFKSPLIALISDKNMVNKIARITPAKKEILEQLTEKFWPGGLTIILKKKTCVPDIMVSGGETVGIRMPDHEVALKVIEHAGGILPTTSANFSGEEAPTTYFDISTKFLEKVDIVIDGGICSKGIESTIIDLSGRKIKILREGIISKEEIENVIGKF